MLRFFEKSRRYYRWNVDGSLVWKVEYARDDEEEVKNEGTNEGREEQQQQNLKYEKQSALD